MGEMRNVPHPPSIARNEFNCPHCGAHSSQTWFTLAAEPIEKGGTPYIHNADTVTRIEANSNFTNQEKLYFVQFAEMMMSGFVFIDSAKSALYHRYTVHNLYLSQCFTCEKFSVWVHDSFLFPKHIYKNLSH